MSRPTARTVIGESPFYEDVRKDLKQTDDDVQMLERARLFVPFLLAGGVLVERDGSPWRDVIEPLANVTGDITKHEEAKARLIEKLEQLLPASNETNRLLDEIGDLVYGYSYYYGRSAYLLGMAVGQQLGRHAFTRGGPG
jgi:hypothetical protein